MYADFTGRCVAAGCEWSCPMVRNAVELVALPPHGAGAPETVMTTGVVAHQPGEGDPCFCLTVTSRDKI